MAEGFIGEFTGESSRSEFALREVYPRLEAGGAAAVVSPLVSYARRGLPARSFARLCELLEVPREQLARVVQMPLRTLARRTLLKPDESERILRIGRLYDRACEVLGSPEAARRWLARPSRALGGAAPLDHADTEPGAREVEDVLGRIEHGVFS
ncbi:MAG: antitoxin Xre/MbcA/ParS toxin-binding domain-containing protein [Limisphaerales bacterium]